MKYRPLGDYLKKQEAESLTLTLDEISKMIGGLPLEAKRPQFWANVKDHHRSRRESWMGAGFNAFYERNTQSIRFERTIGFEKPNYYMTKVWGFSSPVGPLQFATDGWRKNALEKLKPGDLVVVVGTTGKETEPDEKGRLLGVMQPTSEPVMSLDFDVRKNPNDFVDGNYKWPFGLMNIRAWTLTDRPKLNELFSRKFHMDSAQGVVQLTDEEALLVEQLEKKEERLLQPTASAQSRMQRKHGAKGRGTPPPTTTRTGVMHMRRAPAYTYAMQINGNRKDVFKIGWAFDYAKRARQFNHSSMPELGGLEYKPIHFHLWDTAKMAFSMEQRLLTNFDSRRHTANNEILHGVSKEDLESAWIDVVRICSAKRAEGAYSEN